MQQGETGRAPGIRGALSKHRKATIGVCIALAAVVLLGGSLITSGRLSFGRNESEERPTTKATQPAEYGEDLLAVESPPAGTIAMLKVPDGFGTAALTATLKPYGIGPDGAIIGRLLDVKAASANGEPFVRALSRRIVMLRFQGGERITGGLYRSEIELRATGRGSATLVLTKATLEK